MNTVPNEFEPLSAPRRLHLFPVLGVISFKMGQR